ncbi:hypothetical protein [Fodinicurvata sp. EGI_FJ10296]|uniref:hypothetical protein n=1 Tax=Fodinicurvata sp. EGI_FJ10296 TaxID=3231908 RepID=UPI00345212B7
MLLTILSTVSIGIVAAILVIAFRRMVAKPTAGWLPIIGAGIAMLVFHVWTDYTWFRSVARTLPASVIVVETATGASPFEPWTLIAPPVKRFAAVDRATIVRPADSPSLAVVDVMLVQRFGSMVLQRQIYDCVNPQRLDAVEPGDTTVLTRPNTWTAIDPNDPIRRVVCEPIVIA